MLAGINSLQNTKFSLQLNPPWRNWLARSAVNRKVAGSIPAGGVFFGCLDQPHDKITNYQFSYDNITLS